MRTYNRSAELPPVTPIVSKRAQSAQKITADTQLVGIEEAVEALRVNKGLRLSAETIRVYCRKGTWQKGIHWVKPRRQYLFNLNAIYEWLISDQAG